MNLEPKIVPKYKRDIYCIEEKVIAFYARGMPTRNIHYQIKDLYGIKLSAEMVSKIIYTTNIIEGFHRQLRKVTKSKAVFISDEALEKMIYLVSMDVIKKWTLRYKNWDMVLNQLIILYIGRLEKYIK